MKSSGLEFRKFREETRTKVTNVQHMKKTGPTSFREISESREKIKLMSGKKSVFQNQGSHSKCLASPLSSKKNEGNLFAQLLTSRSPSTKKVKGFEESRETSNDSGISFSAFKGISLRSEN